MNLLPTLSAAGLPSCWLRKMPAGQCRFRIGSICWTTARSSGRARLQKWPQMRKSLQLTSAGERMDTATQIIVSGLTLGAMYAISTVSLSLIWGALNVLNMAQGALLTFGGYVAYATFTMLG